MKNNIIVFRGNPIEEMNGCFELTRKIFYVNEIGMDDIKDNSTIITENEVPPLLKEQIVVPRKDQVFYMLTREKETTENRKIPATILAIENIDNNDYPYKILGTYSYKGLYLAPEDGEEVFLKMHQSRLLRKSNSQNSNR